MSAIFLNYRRDDSSGYAGRLFDNLVTRFGRERVFMDIETLEPGLDFVDGIDRAIRSCGAVIAIIGPNWLMATNSKGGRRLDDPNDFIRLEISTALKRDIRVIPVLVHNASMPTEDELPEPLRRLCRLQSFEISDNRWEFDVGRLADVLAPVIAESGTTSGNGTGVDSAAGRAQDDKVLSGHKASPRTKPVASVVAGTLLVAVAVLGGSWWFSQQQAIDPDQGTMARMTGSPATDQTKSTDRQQAPPPALPSSSIPEPASAKLPGMDIGEQQPATARSAPERQSGMAEDPRPLSVPRASETQPTVAAAPHDSSPPASFETERQAQEQARKERAETIAELLDLARTDLTEMRLTRPAGDNAYERFREVLELDPENTDARGGLQTIVERYQGLLEDAIARGNFDTAERHLESVHTIDPNTDWLPAAQAEIGRLRALQPIEPAVESLRPQTNQARGREACLGDCERGHEHCRQEIGPDTETICLDKRSPECKKLYDDCMSDAGNLVIWGRASHKSQCAGIHAQCERSIAEECANADRTSDDICDSRFEDCVRECRTAR